VIEPTQEEALGQADALAGQALNETEARCTVLAEFINDCEAKRARPPEWNEALREFHALHDYRFRLMRRRSLIQHALDYPVGECPAKVSLPPPPNRTAVRTQKQVQVQVQAQRQRS
jgi:hypothetical protein